MQRPATGHDHCTCHFPPHLSGTVPNPPNEKLVLPRLHPQEKMNRNARCWCLSGKKWKVCHRDRDKQTPLMSSSCWTNCETNSQRVTAYIQTQIPTRVPQS